MSYSVPSKQGLLKVAIDNTRAQDKQVQTEKSELKMELFRERELRETLERQLTMEQKNRGWLTLHYPQHTAHYTSLHYPQQTAHYTTLPTTHRHTILLISVSSEP